jgi:hypothetical protein
MTADLNARGLQRNPYCSRCGDTRGGPYGHEMNECTWGRQDDEE